jgi:hypothetical protein
VCCGCCGWVCGRVRRRVAHRREAIDLPYAPSMPEDRHTMRPTP